MSQTKWQVLSNQNRAGELYVVDVDVTNVGIPMAESFSIQLHICLKRASPPETDDEYQDPRTNWCQYSCHGNIKYKKAVWGILKGK